MHAKIFSMLRLMQKKQPALVVHVGSRTVLVALVMFEKGSKPIIVNFARDSVSRSEIVDRSNVHQVIISALGGALDDLGRRLKKDDHIKLKKGLKTAYVSISSPWSVSKKVSVVKHEKDRFLVTESIITDLVEAAKKDMGTGYEDSTFIESKVSHMKADGYEVDDILRKSVKSIDLTMFFTVTNSKFVGAITDKILEQDRKLNIELVSAAFSNFVSVREVCREERDYIILRVADGISELQIVKQDTLLASSNIDIGIVQFVEAVSQALKTTNAVAMSFLLLYTKGKTEHEITEKIKNAIQKPLENFRDLLIKSLTHASEEYFVPSQVKVVIVDEFYEIVSSVVGQLSFKDSPTLPKKGFVPTLIGKEVYDGYVDGLFGINDPMLRAVVLYIHIILNK